MQNHFSKYHIHIFISIIGINQALSIFGRYKVLGRPGGHPKKLHQRDTLDISYCIHKSAAASAPGASPTASMPTGNNMLF